MTAYDKQNAKRICAKWTTKIGIGFHPDTRGKDYEPRLSGKEARDYESDMNTLFSLNVRDPYAFVVEAMEYNIKFADPGGKSALRAASKRNPRNLPCPNCGAANCLTPADRARGYQCDSCANRDEAGGW